MTDSEAFEEWWFAEEGRYFGSKISAARAAWQAAIAQRTEPQQQDAMERYCHIELPGVRAALSQQVEPVAHLQQAVRDSRVLPGRYETCDPGDYGAFPVYRAIPPADDEAVRLLGDIKDRLSKDYAPWRPYIARIDAYLAKVGK